MTKVFQMVDMDGNPVKIDLIAVLQKINDSIKIDETKISVPKKPKKPGRSKRNQAK